MGVLVYLTAGQNIRKLVKDGFVIRKPQIIHSRSRARVAAEAKAKGRHSGFGELLAAAARPRR
jgi:ribosomal protein L19E